MSEHPRVYTPKHTKTAFLLGGIGTGNFSIGPRGNLQDFELYSKPDKGLKYPYAHFAISCLVGETRTTKILEARRTDELAPARGISPFEMAGLPRFETSEMTVRYPFANIHFIDGGLPLDVRLEAFTPFIPLDTASSSLPAAVFSYTVKNTSDAPAEVSVCGTMPNMSSFRYDYLRRPIPAATPVNERWDSGTLRGVYYTPGISKEACNYGESYLAADAEGFEEAFVRPEWYRSDWPDDLQDYWDTFSATGRLSEAPELLACDEGSVIRRHTGSAGLVRVLQPGEEAVFRFFYGWWMPHRSARWDPLDAFRCFDGTCDKICDNHYATVFAGAREAVEYLKAQLPRLEAGSRLFADTLYGSTLPREVIDAVANNITVLRSPTCFRLGDGTFCAWEGCDEDKGSCAGTCTHVWNYAQTLAFLFPDLERNMRSIELLRETDEEGCMHYRNRSVLEPMEHFPGYDDDLAASDGQLGTLLRFWRECLLCGDKAYLEAHWPKAKAALEYAARFWDSDGDCVLDARQPNTYDIDFYGVTSFTNTLFYAALLAGAKMARLMGEEDAAARYEEIARTGAQHLDEMAFNGEFYPQVVDEETLKTKKYQYGAGCLSDQVFGQFLADITGLGPVLPREHLRAALRSIYKYNFIRGLHQLPSAQRTYALNDESGLVLCTWPRGGRTRFPFTYSDEVWTGIEYHVAATMIYEDMLEEGLELIKAVDERYDGIRRNPFSQFECGNHYARSMASYGVLTALCGFSFNGFEGKTDFDPKINQDDFRSFYSDGRSWGILRQTIRDGKKTKEVIPLYTL